MRLVREEAFFDASFAAECDRQLWCLSSNGGKRDN